MSRAESYGSCCGRMGCPRSSQVVAIHPVYGRIVTCWECADGLEVVARV